MRSNLGQAFKQYSKGGKVGTSKKYGINYKAIFEYIGLCPGKYEDYHIDHIKPLCSFNLDDPEQVKLAFAPENHRWITKEENIKKGVEDRRKSLRNKAA